MLFLRSMNDLCVKFFLVVEKNTAFQSVCRYILLKMEAYHKYEMGIEFKMLSSFCNKFSNYYSRFSSGEKHNDEKNLKKNTFDSKESV